MKVMPISDTKSRFNLLEDTDEPARKNKQSIFWLIYINVIFATILITVICGAFTCIIYSERLRQAKVNHDLNEVDRFVLDLSWKLKRSSNAKRV